MESFEKTKLSGIYEDACDLKLENLYNQCNAELGLQQSKRDQIIAFYIAIISFLVPAIIDLSLPALAQALAYGVLWGIGMILCSVVRRYRVYKEVYWLTSRTISTLMRVKKEHVSKDVIQKIFAETMRMVQPTVVVVDPKADIPLAENADKDAYKTCISYSLTRKKNKGSSEFLLYKLISLMTCVVLSIAVFSLVSAIAPYAPSWLPQQAVMVASVIVGAIPGLVAYNTCISRYIIELSDIYAYCFDGRKDHFNAVYQKAWFLHSFVSQDDEESAPEEAETEKEECAV